MLSRWKYRVRQLKTETYALYLACRDPRVPWYAKAVAGFVVAYALSPIDLIPDFIPVLGYLDDLIIIPLGLLLAVRMIPPQVLTEAREQASLAAQQGRLSSRAGAAIVLVMWAIGAVILLYFLRRWTHGRAVSLPFPGR